MQFQRSLSSGASVYESIMGLFFLPRPISSANFRPRDFLSQLPLECVTSFRCITLNGIFDLVKRSKHNMTSSKYISCLFLPFFSVLLFLFFFLFLPYTPTVSTSFHPSASSVTFINQTKKKLPHSSSIPVARSCETIPVDIGPQKVRGIIRAPECIRYQQILQKSLQSLSVSTDPNTGNLNSGLCSHPEQSESLSIASMSTSSFNAS